jgi:hypothetical protein
MLNDFNAALLTHRIGIMKNQDIKSRGLKIFEVVDLPFYFTRFPGTTKQNN